MNKLLLILVFSFAVPFSAQGLGNVKPISQIGSKANTRYATDSKNVLITQNSKKRKKKRPSSRELNVVREKRYKKDKKNIDFEAASLYGARKLPMGSMIGQGKSDKSFDLIRIRSNWNPEMIQSTSSLER